MSWFRHKPSPRKQPRFEQKPIELNNKKSTSNADAKKDTPVKKQSKK